MVTRREKVQSESLLIAETEPGPMAFPMKFNYDVVIIGAGPAGSSCARTLTAAGKNVLVAEQKTLPRYKACGGLLSARARAFLQETFGEMPQALLCETPCVQTLISRTGRAYARTSNGAWTSVKRREFDAWLNRECGACIQDSMRYVSHTCCDEGVKVKLRDAGGTRTLGARFLIGADGGNSRVRAAIASRTDQRNTYGYVQWLYEGESGLAPDAYYFLIGRAYTDLLAAFCLKDGLVYVGSTFLMSNRDNAFHANLLAHLKERFNLRIARRVRGEGCLFGLNPKKDMFFAGRNRVLLAGESAGLITALGEGIASALISGRAAGEAVCQALDEGKDGLALYVQRVDPERLYVRKTHASSLRLF